MDREKEREIQAHLGDMVGLVPEHHNKANIVIKQIE